MFALELFGEQTHPPVVASWSSLILDTTKSAVRTGLKDELRDTLLAKYELKDDLTCLGPPRVNKEILPNLSELVTTRDKHQENLQAQVGASLHALGSGISELSKLECLQTSTEAKAAVTKIAEGVRLIADHQFRLSRMRRAFIVPSLNFLGKTVSDSAPIDECLFGNNFAEEVNAAQSIEKVARKMARKPPPPPGPPARRPATQQPTPRVPSLREEQRRPGNLKPPLRKATAAHHSRRGFFQASRTRRSSSRSRPRPRPRQ